MTTLFTFQFNDEDDTFMVEAQTEEEAVFNANQFITIEMENSVSPVTNENIVKKQENQADYNDFLIKYKPILNPRENANCDGLLFESLSKDIAFVQKPTIPINCVWSLLEEDSHMWIVAGYKIVNRVGWFVTEIARETPEEENLEYFYA